MNQVRLARWGPVGWAEQADRVSGWGGGGPNGRSGRGRQAAWVEGGGRENRFAVNSAQVLGPESDRALSQGNDQFILGIRLPGYLRTQVPG